MSVEGSDDDKSEGKSLAEALDLVEVVALLQRVDKEDDAKGVKHEATEGVVLDQQDVGQAVRLQADA